MAFTKVTLTGAVNTLKEGWTAFNTLIDDLFSTSAGKGASQIGLQDAAGNFDATNVETFAAEVYADTASTRSLAEIFDEKGSTTTGLTWGYYGGSIRLDNAITVVAAGTVVLADDDTNYVELQTNGTVSRNTTGFTSGRVPLRQIVTSGGVQTTSTDKRAWFAQVAAATPTTSGTIMVLDEDDMASDSAVKVPTQQSVKAYAGAAHEINMGDNLLNRPQIKDYSETKTAPASASNVLTLDIVNGNVFATTLTENVTTFNFNNPSPTGKACSFTWIMTQHSTAVSITWPAAVKWDSGTAPTITTNNGIYTFTFVTVDEGTTWLGFLAGSEMAVPA